MFLKKFQYNIKPIRDDVWIKYSLKKKILFIGSLLSLLFFLLLVNITVIKAQGGGPAGPPPTSNVVGRFSEVHTSTIRGGATNTLNILDNIVSITAQGTTTLNAPADRTFASIISTKNILLRTPSLILQAPNASTDFNLQINKPLYVDGTVKANKIGSYYRRRRVGNNGKVQNISCLAGHGMVSCNGRQIDSTLLNGLDPQLLKIFQGTHLTVSNNTTFCNSSGHVVELSRTANDRDAMARRLVIQANNPNLEVSVICFDPMGVVSGQRNP